MEGGGAGGRIEGVVIRLLRTCFVLGFLGVYFYLVFVIVFWGGKERGYEGNLVGIREFFDFYYLIFLIYNYLVILGVRYWIRCWGFSRRYDVVFFFKEYLVLCWK